MEVGRGLCCFVCLFGGGRLDVNRSGGVYGFWGFVCSIALRG